jgi:50S ribosomal protein L16 3-hydroxylase
MIVKDAGVQDFLRDYWQKRPVLLRQALPGFVDPLSPEQLAGLACEVEVESRLVFTRRKTWDMKSGPFRTKDFTSLPARNWTLLVQAVDQWLPEVRQLLATVPFLPSWRVDDVMISYATANGGVGPHFDYYDVFLVQGQGSRIWKTGQHCTTADTLRTDSGLKLLKKFHTEHEWHLQSGDVLYVPPGIAHWGVSVDDSLCYSIGFRAPSLADAVLGYSEELAASLSPDLRFLDPKRQQPLRAGEISPVDLQQARRQLQQVLHDDAALARWFGLHMTQPRYPEQIQPAASRLQQNSRLALHPASRLAWIEQARQLQVFVDGDSQLLPASQSLRSSLQALASGASVAYRTMARNHACLEWCQSLLTSGSLQVENGDV